MDLLGQASLPLAATIQAIRRDNYRTKTFVLDARLDARPGQFVMAWLPRFDEKPFSLVNADPVTLMVTAVGPFTGLLHEKRAGDRLWIRGPFGQGFQVPAHHQHIALVGGGYGVAPLYWLARAQSGQTPQITTIIGARTAADVLYAHHFQLFEQIPLQAISEGDATAIRTMTRHRVMITTEDGSLGQQGRVTDALEPLLAAGQVNGIYACGPHGMLAALEALSARYGVPCQLSWEAYMRCAVGICGACEHDGQLLCLDGPVLRCL